MNLIIYSLFLKKIYVLFNKHIFIPNRREWLPKKIKLLKK